MLIVMDHNTSRQNIDNVADVIKQAGLDAFMCAGVDRMAIGINGNPDKINEATIVRMPGVKEVVRISKPYKRVSREVHPENSTVKINDQIIFGAGKPVIIAGPCRVESAEQITAITEGVKKLGAHMLRGGAFKPRTSPYSFQGMGVDGLKLLKQVGEKVGLPVISEITSADFLDEFAEFADMIQIGARNMQNFDLLTKVARLNKPILLKRGMSATVTEFLLAAEYILNEGNDQVVLCERGIRTFENSTRNILDLNSLALIKSISHLPIIADPSHAAGQYDLVAPLSYAALSAGADGLIVEVHNKPDEALSDGAQSLTFDNFEEMMKNINNIQS